MLRLLPIVLLTNTVNSQTPQYQYRSEIEIGFDCELLNIENYEGDQLNVLMEFRYEGYIEFNSAYDKEINIISQYGNIYYYANSELVYSDGFSNAYGFTFYEFELSIYTVFSENINVDFGADNFTVAFNSTYFNTYINELTPTYVYQGGTIMDYFIDEGEGTIFTRFLGSQIGFQLSSYSNFNDGYNYGYAEGQKDGRNKGIEEGRIIGYSEGLADGYTVNETAFTIFNGILSIGMIPVNVFLSFFNFDILGINMSAFVSALLSVSMVVIIFRFLFNGKSGD